MGTEELGPEKTLASIRARVFVGFGSGVKHPHNRDWLKRGAGAVCASSTQTVTALGKRGEAYSPKGDAGRLRGASPWERSEAFAEQTPRGKPAPRQQSVARYVAGRGWVCFFGGAGQVRQREADEAEAVRAAVSLPVLSPAKTERLNTAGRMSARRPRQNEFC